MPRIRFALSAQNPNAYITLQQAKCLIIFLENSTTENFKQIISKRMGLPTKTVARYLNYLCEVFDCSTQEELVEKATQLPWQEWKKKIASFNRQDKKFKRVDKKK